jgi:SHS2 domain-containing protein
MNNEDRSEVGHRAVPNADDVIVEAWAPTRSGCLEELVLGVVSTFTDTHGIIGAREVPLEIGAPRDEDVVVALLDDVYYLLDTDELVVVDVALDEEDNGCFAGTFFVVPVAASELTAGSRSVSHSDVLFASDGSLWRGRVHVRPGKEPDARAIGGRIREDA